MKGLWLIALLLTAFLVPVFGQTEPPAVCPTISVSGPDGIVMPGDTARYVVNVKGQAEYPGLEYRWTLSDGKIISGQGTAAIDIQQPNEAVTATVEVIGLPNDCPNVASETVACTLQAPVPIKLDEFITPIASVGPE